MNLITEKKLARHEDNRGILFEIFRKDVDKLDAKQVYFSRSYPGAIRGNHFHQRKIESFCVVSGIGELMVEDVNSKKFLKIELRGEEPKLVIIYPEIAHKIKAIGTEEMLLLVLVTEEFDPSNQDVFPYEISEE